MPPEHAYTIRNKLFNLKQNASVADYNASFMRLKQQLTNLGTDDVIFTYLIGLNPKIQELVRSQKDNQADLHTLQNVYLRVDIISNRLNDRSMPQEEAHMTLSLMSTPSTNRGGFRGRNGRRGGGYRG